MNVFRRWLAPTPLQLQERKVIQWEELLFNLRFYASTLAKEVPKERKKIDSFQAKLQQDMSTATPAVTRERTRQYLIKKKNVEAKELLSIRMGTFTDRLTIYIERNKLSHNLGVIAEKIEGITHSNPEHTLFMMSTLEKQFDDDDMKNDKIMDSLSSVDPTTTENHIDEEIARMTSAREAEQPLLDLPSPPDSTKTSRNPPYGSPGAQGHTDEDLARRLAALR
jgi:hypothetical protein